MFLRDLPGGGQLAAVIPDHFHRRPVAFGGEVVGDDAPGRVGLIVVRAVLRLDPVGGVEIQCVEGGVGIVHGHVAQSTAAKVPPAAPFARAEVRMVGACLGGAQPEVPVQIFGHGRCVGGVGFALGIPEFTGAVRPHMHLGDFADGTGLNPLAG